MIEAIFTLLVAFILSLIVYEIVRSALDGIRIPNVNRKSVLISGCDSGFGLGLAKKCHAEGMLVFAGCLTKEGMHNLKPFGERMRPFILDVGSDESVKMAHEFVTGIFKETHIGLDFLVNNAGTGRFGFDDWLKVEDYAFCWNINALGMIRVTHAFKHFIKKSRGRIVNMTSSYGRAVAPIYGPYTVSKFAADAYTSTIRQELHRCGVKAITMAPGYILTPITRVAMINGVEQTWKAAPREVRDEYGHDFCSKWQKGLLNLLDMVPRGQNVDLVVNQYFAAMTSVFPRERYSVGVDAKFFFVPISLLPSYVSDNIVRLCIWYFSSKETSFINGN